MEELISVIVPVYNAQSTLERCINSILQQTYKKLEIICIDDGSQDNSLDILRKFEENGESLKVISKSNEGVSVARNEGIKESTGQYILFVDSDDYIEKNMIRDLYQAIKKVNADVAIEGYKEVNSEREFEVYDYKNCVQKEEFLLKCIQNTGGVVCSKLYRSSLIKGNDIFFRKYLTLSEDLIFALECFKKAIRLVQIEKADYIYDRRNEKYRDVNVVERLKKNIGVHELIVNILNEEKIENKDLIFRKRITDIIYANLSELVRRRKYEEFINVRIILQKYIQQMSLNGYDIINKLWLKAYAKKLFRISYVFCLFRIKLVKLKRK